MTMSTRERNAHSLSTWRIAASALGVLVAFTACNEASPTGTLVGFYAIQGVLIENTCGQTALPAATPLKFDVQIREDNGVGYWMRSKQGQSTGSLDSHGEFSFSTSQTKLVSMQAANSTQLQPSNFTTLQPDFDLQQRRSCALTITEMISGTLQRRNAADGGAVVMIGQPDAAVVSDGDLEAEHVIDVSPSAGSDCNDELAALGGNYNSLPCHARYVLHGSLQALSSAGVVGGSAAPH